MRRVGNDVEGLSCLLSLMPHQPIATGLWVPACAGTTPSVGLIYFLRRAVADTPEFALVVHHAVAGVAEQALRDLADDDDVVAAWEVILLLADQRRQRVLHHRQAVMRVDEVAIDEFFRAAPREQLGEFLVMRPENADGEFIGDLERRIALGRE